MTNDEVKRKRIVKLMGELRQICVDTDFCDECPFKMGRVYAFSISVSHLRTGTTSSRLSRTEGRICMTYEQEQLFEAAKKLQKVCENFLCEECPMYTEMGCRLVNREPYEWNLDVVEAVYGDK